MRKFVQLRFPDAGALVQVHDRVAGNRNQQQTCVGARAPIFEQIGSCLDHRRFGANSLQACRIDALSAWASASQYRRAIYFPPS